MKKILFAFFIICLLSACSKDKCDYNECAIVAPTTEIQNLKDYLTANNITATQHCSGIFYVVNDAGNGDWPTACDQVTVRYKGTLTNGTVFDQTQGNATTNFRLNELIPGFTNGTIQIKSGGKVTIYIPPSLGYGSRQAGTIPPNSNLIFTVELVDIQ